MTSRSEQSTERQVTVTRSDGGTVESEFDTMRTRFESEMRRVEDEMHRLRREFEAYTPARGPGGGQGQIQNSPAHGSAGGPLHAHATNNSSYYGPNGSTGGGYPASPHHQHQSHYSHPQKSIMPPQHAYPTSTQHYREHQTNSGHYQYPPPPAPSSGRSMPDSGIGGSPSPRSVTTRDPHPHTSVAVAHQHPNYAQQTMPYPYHPQQNPGNNGAGGYTVVPARAAVSSAPLHPSGAMQYPQQPGIVAARSPHRGWDPFQDGGSKSPLIRDDSDKKTLRLRFNVSQYAPEEISVRTVDSRLLVQAKHEEKAPGKTVFREYNQEFLLPRGTNPEDIVSNLSPDGVLTVEAPIPPGSAPHSLAASPSRPAAITHR